MSFLSLSPCVLILLFAGAGQQQPSSQHGTVKLAWKFKEKDRFYLESHVNQTQLRRGGGQLHKDILHVQVISSFTVNKVNSEDKSVLLEQKIEDARFAFDGTDRMNAALQADLFAKLKGATFQITLAEDGKVVKLEGYDALIKSIAANSRQDADHFKAMVSEDSLKNATEEGFACYPQDAVKIGEKWTRPVLIPVPPAGTIKGENAYMLKSVTKGKAKITSKCDKWEFQPDANLPNAYKCEFGLDGREHNQIFDIEKGRLVSAETTVRYHGKITKGGEEGAALPLLDVEMQQTVKIMVRDRYRN